MSAPLREKGALREAGNGWGLPDEAEATPELRWPASIQVYSRMRQEESQVASVLRAVKMPVLRTPRRIDGTGCRPEVTQMVAEDLGLPITGKEEAAPLRTRDRFSISEHLRLALTSLDYGHAVFEQVYRMDDAGFARLRKLGWRPPRTITKWDEAPDGGLRAIEQIIAQPTLLRRDITATVRLPVSRLVVYSHEREESWIGRSMLRPAYKYWLLKDQLLRTQQQTIIRNGMGIPVHTAAKLPDDSPMSLDAAQEWMQQQIDEGLKIAEGFRSGENAGASLPNGATLALKGVEGRLPDALPVIRYYDEQVARAALAHFLNLGTQTGSWALGTTFSDFFSLSLQALSDSIDDTLNAHVIEDMVDVNFGPSEPAPRIVSDRIGAALTAEALKNLVDAGVITPDDPLENYTRAAYGLPVRDLSTTRTATEEVPADAP